MRKVTADIFSVNIDQLRLSIPGVSSAEGKQLANDVVSAIKSGINTAQPNNITGDISLDKLQVKISRAPGQTINGLANSIAKQILSNISQANGYGGVK